MGRHMMQEAVVVELDNPRLKLAFMCFAESARDTDRVAFPGTDLLLKWTNVKRSQLHNLINRLIELQLIERTQRACRNRRAEYRLFPLGCCVAHGKTAAHRGVDDADVVVIGASTGEPDHARTVDPLTGALGPIREPNGSNPRAEWVQSPRSESAASLEALQEPSPDSSYDHQPPTSRDPTEVSTSRSVVADLARLAAVAARGSPCRHCDAGELHDRDGLPAGDCPHCKPATRTETG